MKGKDVIMLAREYAPLAIRTLAQLAREADNPSAKKQAVSQLVARRFLSTSQPTVDDLRRIENMTDDEIMEALHRASH